MTGRLVYLGFALPHRVVSTARTAAACQRGCRSDEDGDARGGDVEGGICDAVESREVV
jgi:hypothetical protein